MASGTAGVALLQLLPTPQGSATWRQQVGTIQHSTPHLGHFRSADAAIILHGWLARTTPLDAFKSQSVLGHCEPRWAKTLNRSWV